MRIVLAGLLLIATLPALAQDVDPPLPRPRPAIATSEEAPIPLPRRRPDAPKPAEAPDTPETPAAPDGPPPDPEAHIEAEEEPAPPRIYQAACPAVLLGQVEARALPPISEAACGEQSPLAVTGVLANGRMVPFSGEATLNCGMATALPAWVADVDNYLRAHDNTGVASVIVGTSYMCRNVNNASAGNLSFHAFAAALDVVGFKLEDGRTVTIEQGWGGTEEQGSRIVRFAHDAACTGFTTVLGPEANALHHDHLHLDLGCHGKTCTARLCE